jgi:hypothetical protein
MPPLIPWYLVTFIVVTNIAIAVSVWTILSAAANRSGLAPAARQKIRIGAGILLGAWLGAALALAASVPLFVAVPVSFVLLALGFSPGIRRVVVSASLPALIGVQVYRVIGLVFLILLAQGQLPAHFALPAGWGDVAVGVSAPLVALALSRGVRGARTLALAWNGFGLLDLVVAVGMGTGYLAPLLAPALGAQVDPAAAMARFPLILVPTFAVPVSVLLHLIALRRLLGGGKLGLGAVPKAA